jgi:hypothetical protein
MIRSTLNERKGRQFAFPAVVTAMDEFQLKSPLLDSLIENWLSIARRVIIVIGRDSHMDERKGVRIYRSKTNDIYLRDVIEAGVSTMNTDADVMVLMDPMCQMRLNIIKVFDPIKKRNLGISWAAASLAVQLDHDGTPGDVDTTGIRWFAAPSTMWSRMIPRLSANVPFTHPVWSGTAASLFGKNIHYQKYHDVTSLFAVARLAGPDNPSVSTAGFGSLTFNPPTLSYVDRLSQVG